MTNPSTQIYIDSYRLNDVGFDLLYAHRSAEVRFLVEFTDIIENDRHLIYIGKPYIVETTISVKKAKAVLSMINLSPVSLKVKRLGIFKKRLTITF